MRVKQTLTRNGCASESGRSPATRFSEPLPAPRTLNLDRWVGPGTQDRKAEAGPTSLDRRTQFLEPRALNLELDRGTSGGSNLEP